MGMLWAWRGPELPPVVEVPRLPRTTARPAPRPEWGEVALPSTRTRFDGLDPDDGRLGFPDAGEPDAIPGEFVFGFYDAADQAAFLELAEARGVEILDYAEHGYSVLIRVRSAEDLRQLLADGPTPVEYAPNYYVRIPAPPALDPREPSAEGYAGFGAKALEWLGVPADHGDWGAGVTIALLDTGVGVHPLLKDAHLAHVDLLGLDDPAGAHGTAVASLLAGRSTATAGIAPSARIVDIRVLSAEGLGDTYTLAQGIIAAANAGADIINICVGTQGDSFVVEEAIRYALAGGAAVVAAAGNQAVAQVTYPARYEGVTAVAAVDANGQHVFFSNRGPEVDLAAPGVQVNAAWTNGTVAGFSGTSAAVPFVSGALAGLLSEQASLTAAEAVAVLQQYADDSGAPGRDNETGSGVLNMERVLARNEPGIYDAAVGDVTLSAPATSALGSSVIVSIQNRGTEPLRVVDLRVEIGGVVSEWTFYNVAVGRTAWHTFRLDTAGRGQGGTVEIWCEATLRNEVDADLGNNTRKAILTLAGE